MTRKIIERKKNWISAVVPSTGRGIPKVPNVLNAKKKKERKSDGAFVGQKGAQVKEPPGLRCSGVLILPR